MDHRPDSFRQRLPFRVLPKVLRVFHTSSRTACPTNFSGYLKEVHGQRIRMSETKIRISCCKMFSVVTKLVLLETIGNHLKWKWGTVINAKDPNEGKQKPWLPSKTTLTPPIMTGPPQTMLLPTILSWIATTLGSLVLIHILPPGTVNPKLSPVISFLMTS